MKDQVEQMNLKAAQRVKDDFNRGAFYAPVPTLTPLQTIILGGTVSPIPSKLTREAFTKWTDKLILTYQAILDKVVSSYLREMNQLDKVVEHLFKTYPYNTRKKNVMGLVGSSLEGGDQGA